MKHREQLSASTSFGVKQMDDAEPLDLGALKEMLQEPQGK